MLGITHFVAQHYITYIISKGRITQIVFFSQFGQLRCVKKYLNAIWKSDNVQTDVFKDKKIVWQ